MIEDIYKKDTTNILKSKRLNAFPLRSGTKESCPLSQLPFNVIQGVLASALRQEKKIKSRPIRKRKIKLSLFTDDMIIWAENYRAYQNKKKIKQNLELISEFSKVRAYKINI